MPSFTAIESLDAYPQVIIPTQHIPNGADVLKVKEPWCSMILSGRKSKEIRGSVTKKRGWIYISPSGFPNIVGQAWLENCTRITNESEWLSQTPEHCVSGKALPYKKTFAWHLKHAARFEVPVHHKAARGCVVWSHFESKEAKKNI